MLRGLMLGAAAFVTVFIAERQFGTFGKDIERYNTMRAMSGDPPLVRQGLGMLGDLVKSFGDSKRGDALGLAEVLQHDLVRYARISAM